MKSQSPHNSTKKALWCFFYRDVTKNAETHPPLMLDVIIEQPHILQNIKNIAQKCKKYDIQKVLISGLLTTNRLAQDFIEEVNKLIKNMCNIEGYCYVNNDNITPANLFKDALLYTCWMLASRF